MSSHRPRETADAARDGQVEPRPKREAYRATERMWKVEGVEYGYGSRPRAGAPVASPLTARSPHGAALPHQLTLVAMPTVTHALHSLSRITITHKKYGRSALTLYPLLLRSQIAQTNRGAEFRRGTRLRPLCNRSLLVLQPLPVFAAPKHGSCSRGGPRSEPALTSYCRRRRPSLLRVPEVRKRLSDVPFPMRSNKAARHSLACAIRVVM